MLRLYVGLRLHQGENFVGNALDSIDFGELLPRAEGLSLFKVLECLVVPDQVDQEGGSIEI